jgi:hypothetical protein
MKKIKRVERLDSILKVLNEANNGISISDLHKKLSEEFKLEITRKTIERDIADIVKKGFFLLDSKHPMTVYPAGIKECIIHLTNEDITYLIVVLPEGHSLRDRLKSFMGLDNFCHNHDE